MPNKEQYAKRKSAGTCTECGAVRDDGNIRCSSCLDKAKQRARNLRNHRKSQGLCINCGNPKTIMNILRCEDCRNRNSDNAKAQRKKWRERLPELYGTECYLKDELCTGRMEVDHINGRSFENGIPDSKMNFHAYYNWLCAEKRDNFVTLCHYHNQMKGGIPPDKMIEYGEKLKKFVEENNGK